MNFLVETVGITTSSLPYCLVRKIYSSPVLASRVISLLEKVTARSNGKQAVKIATGPIAGLTFIVDLHRQKYFWLGTFEPWVQDAIVRYFRPGMHLWDAGAFTGFHTLLMRKLAGPHRVIAIEPDPKNREQLQMILRLNGFDDVAVIDQAITERLGRAKLVRVSNGPSMTRVIAADNGDVKCITLDELLKTYPAPGIVKIDIEGGEALALQGAAKLLNNIRPIWILEVHGEQGKMAVQMLRSANYIITKIDRWIPEASELIGGGSEQVIAVPN